MRKFRMLKLLFVLLAPILSLLFLVGCRENDESPQQFRKVQFKVLGEKVINAGGRVANFEPDELLISIQDANAQEVLTLEKVEIYQLDDGYISAAVELPVGEYELTLFALIDVEDNIIAATPMETSPTAEYVDDPLPIQFIVNKNETTIVYPQVLLIEAGVDIGYGEFGIDIVKLLPITVNVFDQQTRVSADILIEGLKNSEVVWTKQASLADLVNELSVKGELDSYQFTVTKQGYHPVMLEVSGDDLKNNPDRSFYLVKIEPQLLSITGDVYCCPGWGFVPTKIDLAYNGNHLLNKTTYSYYQNDVWIESYNVVRTYNPNSNTAFNLKYNYASGANVAYQNTLSTDGIVSIKTIASQGAGIGNYFIALIHDPLTGLLTSAILHDYDYSLNLNYTYSYNTDGDLLSFEVRYDNNALLYSGEFTYDAHKNIYPSHVLARWLENMMNSQYSRLMHIPFLAGTANHNIVSFKLLSYDNGNLSKEETLNMNYTYDANGLPASLNVSDKVAVVGQQPIVIERQKSTVFQYQ